MGLLNLKNKELPICVVRISTSYFKDTRGVAIKKTIHTLKRKSNYDYIKEMFDDLEIDCSSIINLSECKDGLYNLTMINESRDFETGHIDDWDYKLIPYCGS